MQEEDKRIEYCRKHNIHHLFELMATKVLVERPDNPFEYLRDLLVSVEASENRAAYDPTSVPFDDSTAQAGKAESSRKPLKKIILGTFGLNNAGKTTLISALSGSIDTNCIPTVGFTPVQFQTDELDICIFDLGGADNFRGIWVHYFHDCHGMMFVIDSAADKATVTESLKALRTVVEHPFMKGKPMLLLANKKDLSESVKEAVVPDGFLEELLPASTPHRVVATCSIEADSALDSSVEWLLHTIVGDYETLSERVQADSVKVKEERVRQNAERLAKLRAEANTD